MHLIYANQVWPDEPSGQGSREFGFITALLEARPGQVSVVIPRRRRPIFSHPGVVEIPMRHKNFVWYACYQTFLALRLALEACRRHRPVIHARYGPAMVAPLLISVLLRVPLTVRSGPTFDIFKELRPIWPLRKLISLTCRWTMRGSSAIVTVTEEIRRSLIAEHGIDPRKVFVVPNGVDTRKFIFSNGGDPNLLGYVGTVEASRGLELVVDIAPEILRSHPLARFAITGGGRLLETLRKTVHQRGLSPYFEFHGPVSHDKVPAFIARCGAMLAPFPKASYEGRGSSAMKLYEYLACGKPVVASRHPDHEFLERHEIGILYEPDDGPGLVDAIRSALNLDAASRQNIGAAARSFVEANNSWSWIADAIVRICAKVETN